jgi:hypothetical protein
MFPTKTLERELSYFVVKQLPFFIFPPVRICHNHQKHISKRAKKFLQGKWQELWKQALHEFDLEIPHIQPPKDKSKPQKVSQAIHFHRHGAISKSSKELTSEMKPGGDPADADRLQKLFPSPSENYESPVQLRDNQSEQ